MTINSTIPPPNTPAVDKDGYMVAEWWKFLLTLLDRTGGPGVHFNTADAADQASISAAENMAPDAVWAQQAVSALADLEGISSLRVDPTAADRRMDMLEGMALDARPPVPPAPFVLPIPEGWISPAFAGAWINFGGGYNPAGYFKDPWGIVHLRGRISSGDMNSAVFTLPTGYLPAFTERATASSASVIAIVEIAPSGDVTPVVGTNVSISLDGITFRAA